MKRYSSVCMGILFLGALSAAPVKTIADECVVNLNRGKHNCADIPEIEIKELIKATDGQKGTGRAVIRVTLDGAVNPNGYTEAAFKVKYSSPSEGWTVNIGDSESNNGYRGDAGHQSNDAEMQILRSSLESPNGLTVYGNDYRPEEELNPLLQYTLKGDRPNIKLTVKNQFFGWERRGNIGKMKSEFLYALDGQLDDEGPENYDVYAAFNRTIGSASRDGKGVGKVIIELKRDPDTPVPPSVPTVTSLTGRVWMDRNLGASRVAQSLDDEEAYGDLYQWGRPTDGHEKRNSMTTNEQWSGADPQPDHGDFILVPDYPHSWLEAPHANLWQGADGINNPCPAGFRIPTEVEWQAEMDVYGTTLNALYASPLKISASGYRRGYSTGEIRGEGGRALLASSDATMGCCIRIYEMIPTFGHWINTYTSIGSPVRCIQD